MKPDEKWIEEKKKEFGRIFQVNGNSKEDVYVYRPLRRGEYNKIQEKYVPETAQDGNLILKPSDAMKVEDEVVELCVIWPENIKAEKLEAGVPAILSMRISECSGFTDIDEPIEL